MPVPRSVYEGSFTASIHSKQVLRTLFTGFDSKIFGGVDSEGELGLRGSAEPAPTNYLRVVKRAVHEFVG
ncbi:MAG: hypothetical protein J7K49_06550 [Thaumarchaeota archaeon]|nr:hypothetical protein [Nitrososphaerota archaeon]